jgi:hypothetical protein
MIDDYRIDDHFNNACSSSKVAPACLIAWALFAILCGLATQMGWIR